MTDKATADWVKVGDQFYRRIQLYTEVFDPDLELDNYIVCGAPYSGAVGRHYPHPSVDRTDSF
jgi:vacuolar protein sorting-associated protein 16